MRDIVSPLDGIRSPLGPRSGFNPLTLFAASEQGVWYDPSDLTTMFQDSAGTTPVTAVEQPVGLILDKSGRGNHASQATTTSRPVLSAKVNLLLNSRLNGGVSGSPGTAPTSWTYFTTGVPTITFATDTEAGSGNSVRVTAGTLERQQFSQNVSVSANTTYTISVVADVYGSNAVWNFVTWSTVPAGATVIFQVDGVTVSGGSAMPLGRHVISAVLTVAATAGTAAARFGVGLQGAVTGQDAIFRQVQVQSGSVRTAYQWTNTATDYDTVGFPYYLAFDGVDDSLATSSIDFSGTDKATVFAGVRKQSDAAFQAIAELSVSPAVTTKSFGIGVSLATGDASRRTWGAYAYGTTAATGGVGIYPQPDTKVVSASFDLAQSTAATEIKMRLNGVAQSLTLDAADCGTGNFGNYPIYIGRRGGTSTALNGRIYSLIIRGAASTANQIAATEAWVNGKTGAY